ncbi:hypothetical protein V1278_002632 [Bradyrhizobium sp. AZCC 1577]
MECSCRLRLSGTGTAPKRRIRARRIYVDTSKEVGDVDHIKVFASQDVEAWFSENDPEGVAFEYEVLE